MLFNRIKPTRFFKLLLRYAAEVIIIFLGITISFLFEQWREEQRKRESLVELSESILSDMDALRKKLADDAGGSESWIHNLDSIRIQRTKNTVSEKQLKWLHSLISGQIYFLFDPYSPTYSAAASGGLLHELPEGIRNQLYNLYRVELPFFELLYNEQEKNLTHFSHTVVLPANANLYTDSVALQLDLRAFGREVQRPVYGNFISQLMLMEKEVLKLNKNTVRTLDNLEGSLTAYLHELKD